MAGSGTKYPDLRYIFIRGLIQHERSQRSRHYLKAAAECTSKAIVSLELSPDPIKSIKQARKLEGIGGETCVKLTKLEAERNFSCIKPLGGRFVSSAGGILVAMLEITEQILISGHSLDKPVVIPEEKVRERAEHFTEETFQINRDEAFCPAWWRLEVLIKRGYIKRRSLKRSPVLQLLPLGKDMAETLRERIGLLPVTPSSVPQYPDLSPVDLPEKLEFDDSDSELNSRDTTHPKPEMISAPSFTLEDSLYTNDTGADGLVLLVDTQEMGGERVGLGELCGLINRRGIVYRTKKLKTGDYSWLWRYGGQDIVLPCLVERKRADDLARTLKEGRFWSQVNKMVEWKSQFDGRGVDCKLYYILERRPEEYVVKCTDGCQGIGQCGNPTLQQIKLVIEDLRRHPQLLVRETDSLETTVVLLASLTAELNEGITNGMFDALLQKVLAGNSSESHPLGHVNHDHLHSNNFGQNSSVEQKVEQDEVMERLDSRPGFQAINVTKTSNIPDRMKIESLTFEEELALAIEMSKREATSGSSDNASNPTCDIDKDLSVKKSIDKRTSIDMNWDITSGLKTDNDISKVLEEDDKALSIAVENSKQDVFVPQGVRNDGVASVSARKLQITGTEEDTSFPYPLMQYHCSAGGSVIYPHTSGYRKNVEPNSYRPKMNRKRTNSSRVSSTVCTDIPSHCISDIANNNTLIKDHEVETKVFSDFKAGRWTSEMIDRVPPPFSFDVNSLGPEKENIKGENNCNFSSGGRSVADKVDFSPSSYCDMNCLKDSTGTQNSRKHKATYSESSKSSNIDVKSTISNPSSNMDIEPYDSISSSSEPLKTKPKRVRLWFTPSALNTEPDVVKPQTAQGKKIKGRIKERKGAAISKDSGNFDAVKFKSDVVNVKSGKLQLNSPNKYSCGLVEMVDDDSDLCRSASDSLLNKIDAKDESTVEEVPDDGNGNRSDEDLFPECDGVRIASPVDEESADGLLKDDMEEKAGSPYKTSQETSNLHDSPFTSTQSSSSESLPDLDDKFDKNVEVKYSGRNDTFRDRNMSENSENDHEISHSNKSVFQSFDTEDVHTSEVEFDDCRKGSTPPVTTPLKKDDKVRLVLSVLPHVSERAALATLKTCGGDIELCVSVLLEAQTTSGENTGTTVVDLTYPQNY